MDTWREASPSQSIRPTAELWAAVKVVHAQWQVREPKLRLAQTVQRLLDYGLKHVKEIEQEQEALEVCSGNQGE